MPTFELDPNQAHYQIQGYQPGKLKINDRIHTQSLIVAPNTLVEHWAPQSVEELNEAAFTPLLSLKPTILLIGTGSTLVFIPVEVYGALLNAGIGVEVMSTSAACRTYMVLTSEGRNVAAALIVN